MKFRKTAAFVTSLLLAGSAVFTPYAKSPADTFAVSAKETSYSLDFSFNDHPLTIKSDGILTVRELIKQTELRIFLNTNDPEVSSQELKDISGLIFDIPEITEERKTFEVKISHRYYDCEPIILYLRAFFDDSPEEIPTYEVEADTDSRYGWAYIYENGKEKMWNEAKRILCSNGMTENFMIPAYFGDENSPDHEMSHRIFSLSEHSVCVCESSNIFVPQGIYEIRKNAFYDTESVKTITIADSVKVIEDQDLSKDVVFRGNAGTCAEKFAYRNDYRFEYLGDINDDGNIDDADVLKMYSFMNGSIELNVDEAERADKNMDTDLNIADLIMLKNAVLEPNASSLGASTADACAAPDIKHLDRISKPENIDGYMNFAADTASAVLLETEDQNGVQNTVYSPLSVYMALSMAAECSDGNTLDEFLSVLSADDIEDLRSENSDLFRSLYFDDYLAYLKIANSMWLNNRYKFKQDTLKSVAENYYAASFAKDFSDPDTPHKIADWISENTSGKFRPELRIDDPALELMKIINTVTFKEKWITKFSNARPDTFHLKNGEDIQCDFLKKTTDYEIENIGFADTYMKYALNMEDGYKMNFILPDEGVSIDSIVSDKETMKKIYSDDLEYEKRKLIFSVPKFDAASKFDLIETSEKLGLKDAFDPVRGNFTNVIDYEENKIPGAYISEITHEAKVTINEEGCEAAAYTIISMSAASAAPDSKKPVIFELNRPFFYYISDKNNTPVFSGIINDPTEKN